MVTTHVQRRLFNILCLCCISCVFVVAYYGGIHVLQPSSSLLIWRNQTSSNDTSFNHVTPSNNKLLSSAELKYANRTKSKITEIHDKVVMRKPTKDQPKSQPKPQPKPMEYKHDAQYKQYMKCPSSIRRTMLNCSHLADIFRHDVPILIAKGGINQSEYARLKHFKNMMGWNGAAYEDVANALSVLNTSNNKYLFDDRMVNDKVPDGCVTCAVVGNGGILNGSRMGQEIDSHNYVFRVNAAFTKNYERDVGNKTSFYCFGMVTLYNTLRKYKKSGTFEYPPWNKGIRYVFMPDGPWAYQYIYAILTNRTLPKRGKWEPPKFRFPLSAEDIKLIHPDFSRYLEKSLVKSSHKMGRITTGGLMLLLALHTCDKVDAYGFMGDTKTFTHYYYDKKFQQYSWKTNFHDWFSENELWIKFIEAGVLHIYTRDRLQTSTMVSGLNQTTIQPYNNSNNFTRRLLEINTKLAQ